MAVPERLLLERTEMLEGAAILLAIDQILDMGRTSVNVMGNCIATAVVARWEGVFDDAKMKAFAASQRTS